MVLARALEQSAEGSRAAPSPATTVRAHSWVAAKTRAAEVGPSAPLRRRCPVDARQELSCASLARTRSDSAHRLRAQWRRSSVPRYRAPGCQGEQRVADSHWSKDRTMRTTRSHRLLALPVAPGSSATWLPSCHHVMGNGRRAVNLIPGRSMHEMRCVDLSVRVHRTKSAEWGQDHRLAE